jgi:beta-glucanase (GH16 family)
MLKDHKRVAPAGREHSKPARIWIVIAVVGLMTALPVGAAPRWKEWRSTGSVTTTDAHDHVDGYWKHRSSIRVASVTSTVPTTVTTVTVPKSVTTQAPAVTEPPTVPTTVTSTAPPPPAPPAPTGTQPLGAAGSWSLSFADEFNGTGLDTAKWATKSSAEADSGQGNTGNQQLEWNQAQNCSVSGGALTLTAKPDSVTSPSGHHYDWSSCLLTSTPSYAFRYGYIEERAQFPSQKGFWPAFWTWQAPSVNQWVETDAYEYYSDNHTRLYLTQHSGSGGGCNITLPFDPSTGMHVYGTDVEPTGTDWYVDGALVCHAAATSAGNTNIIDDMFVYSVIPPAPGTVAHKTIDYIRAWQH